MEPILDSFGGYSTDNLSNFYYPYIIVLLMIFRDEVRKYHEHDYTIPRVGTRVKQVISLFRPFDLHTNQHKSNILWYVYAR